MACKYHPDRQVVAICADCGEPICDQCLITISGKDFCEKCISAKAAPRPATPHTMDSGYRVAPDPIPAEHVKPMSVNGFFLFCFSMLPGAGHMYLGFMKKGLLLMSLFFGAIAVTSSYIYGPLEVMAAFSICAVWFWSFFDAIQLKRKMRAGIYVADDISGFLNFLSRNKALLVIVSVVFLIMTLFRSLNYKGFMGFLPGSSSQFAVIALIAIVAGLVFVIKSVGGKKR